MHKSTPTGMSSDSDFDFIEIDYFAEISNWYKSRKWDLPISFLRNTPNKQWYAIRYDKKPAIAACLMTCDDIGVISWVVSDPKRNRVVNLEYLISFIEYQAKQKGVDFIFSIFDNNKILEKCFLNKNYLKGSHCYNFLKRI